MIVDAHTHLGRKESTISARVGDLLQSMDAGLVDFAAVFAGRLNSISTREVIEEIAPHRGRLFAIASVSYGQTYDYGELEYWMGEGVVRGLKLYPGYEPFYPNDGHFDNALKVCEKMGFPVVLHAGDTFSKAGGARLKYAHPLHVDDLAVDHPDLKIIIAHMGYPWHRDAAEVVYKNKNVHADISGFVYGQFKEHEAAHFRKVVGEFIEVAGEDKARERLLFGTDWPISDQQSYVQTCKDIFSYNWLWENLYSRNAVKLFKLEEMVK